MPTSFNQAKSKESLKEKVINFTSEIYGRNISAIQRLNPYKVSNSDFGSYLSLKRKYDGYSF